MKILIICSKKFYNYIPEIETKLKSLGHKCTMPNCYDNPETEDQYRDLGMESHAKWKGEMIKHSTNIIQNNDAVLVLNFKKKILKIILAEQHSLKCMTRFVLIKRYIYIMIFHKELCMMK